MFFAILMRWDIVEQLPAEESDQETLGMLESLFFLVIVLRFREGAREHEIAAFAEAVAQVLAVDDGLNKDEVSTVIARALTSQSSFQLFEHQALMFCYFQVVRQYTLDMKFTPDAVANLVGRAERMTLSGGGSPTPYRIPASGL